MSFCNSIREYCMGLLGELDDTHSEWLSLICAGAEQEILARLRPEVDPGDISESIIIAGALLSVSVMQQLEDPGLADFTAATVKLTFSENHSELARVAYRVIEPWCADSFAFRGVKA